MTEMKNRFWPTRRTSLGMLMGLLTIPGCKMSKSKWIDTMLSEMEVAWTAVDNAGGGQKAREEAINQVVQKYFPVGMPKARAFELLMEMKADGFDIGEYRHEGARDWPDGEFKESWDEATRRNMRRRNLPGQSRITASKIYGKSWLVVEKHGGVSIIIDDQSGVILNSRGGLGLHFI